MKEFPMREIRAAREHSLAGGQALHVHTLSENGHKLFRRYPEIGHLLDQNKERLIETARRLGVRVIKVEREGEPNQHIDLCGRPFDRARAECRQLESEQPDLLDLMGDFSFHFWTCPRGCKGTVEWAEDKSDATCGTCGLTRIESLLPEPKSKNGFASIIGQWPGDETDEEVAQILEDIS
jgi:ribosomal protein S27AE